MYVSLLLYRKPSNCSNYILRVKGALCGIAVNEVEGLLTLNLTAGDLEKRINQDLCNYLSGDLKLTCSSLVGLLPEIVRIFDFSQCILLVD